MSVAIAIAEMPAAVGGGGGGRGGAAAPHPLEGDPGLGEAPRVGNCDRHAYVVVVKEGGEATLKSL